MAKAGTRQARPPFELQPSAALQSITCGTSPAQNFHALGTAGPRSNLLGKDFKDGTGLAIWDGEEASGLTCVSDACTDGHWARMFALA